MGTQLERSRTKKGLVGAIYSHQKQNSKRRGHTQPTYTLDELRGWFRNHPLANALYSAWRLSGYRTGLRPSVDRINDSRGYSFGNIQLMTWAENKAKADADRKSGKMKECQNKAVIQMDLDGRFITEHHSVSSAAKIVGSHKPRISSCCRGKSKTAAGFKWKYKKEDANELD